MMWKTIRNTLTDEEKRNLALVIISGAALLLSLTNALGGVLPFDIAWVAIVLCGIPIVIGSAAAVIREHDIKADVLVSIALIASLCIGEYFAAGEVAFIMAIGTLLEDATARKSRKGIEKLIHLTPKTARIRQNGEMKRIPAEQVKAWGHTHRFCRGNHRLRRGHHRRGDHRRPVRDDRGIHSGRQSGRRRGHQRNDQSVRHL